MSAGWIAGAAKPVDARAAIDRARNLVAKGAAPADPEVQALARSALSRDSTLPSGLELIALAKESRGERAAAAKLYRLSDRISRRSLATRLWLAQDAVERGDVAGTLTGFDIALRTSTAAPGLVFPALGRGLEDPALVAPIAAIVDRPSDWREAFLIYAAETADPRSAAALFLAVRNREVIAKDDLDRKLVARLVEDRQYALARRIDRTFASGPGPAPLVADGTFDNPSARHPFGWAMTDTAEIGASREVESGRPVLAYRANSAEGGQVAAQLLTLPQGSYLLESNGVRSTVPGTPPLWVISCAGNSRVLATLALGSDRQPRSSARFSIPAHCPAQWLTLAVRPALAPQRGWVEQVRITSSSDR